MVTPSQTPFYQKLSLTLVTLAILGLTLMYGQGIILPLLFAMLLAILLMPATNYLANKKFPKVLSIVLPLLLAAVLIGGIIYFLSRQIVNFLDDLPALKERIQEVS